MSSPSAQAERIRPDLSVAPTWKVRSLPHHPWHKPALSTVIAGMLPALLLWSLGQVELALYTLSGGLVAVYGHGVPYRRRAVLMGQFVALWCVGLAVSLCVGAATDNVWLQIVVAAVLSAVVKVAFEASTVGAPGPLLPIFVFSGLVFSSQNWNDVWGHAGLGIAGAVLAWSVVMAPALVRRHGPERRTVSVALLAAAAHAEGPTAATSATLVGALRDAWGALAHAHPSSTRDALVAELMLAERVTTEPRAVLAVDLRAAVGRARGWAGAPAAAHRTHGVSLAPRCMATGLVSSAVLGAFRPGSPATPYLVRTLFATLLAGLLSHALGVGRPYWAIVTAASMVQVNLTLTWQRFPARTLGTVVGVFVFMALAPLTDIHPMWSVVLILGLNAVVEFVVPRTYVFGMALVTPMALLMSEFGQDAPVSDLVGDRLLDTVVGVAVALLVCLAVPNPHLHRRVVQTTAALDEAAVWAESVGECEESTPEQLQLARRRVYEAHATLRGAVASASGEWWQQRHDEEAVAAAEQNAYRALLEVGHDGRR
ncbi:FUSC family protein [Nocardioides yefusunii]|uniref:FUSC family protein n=1 Tax=Nocardioides yefusunii TaxID=2500546 RepID=A0ABW1QWC7_9ACTN|nr:FUSC family protein [Nocardioides yefusunii]